LFDRMILFPCGQTTPESSGLAAICEEEPEHITEGTGNVILVVSKGFRKPGLFDRMILFPCGQTTPESSGLAAICEEEPEHINGKKRFE